MKRFLVTLTALISLVSLSPLRAQRIDKPGEPYYVYCRVNYVSSQMEICLDGQVTYPYIVDENGMKIKFDTRLAAIAYMSKRGWEYVESQGIEPIFKKKVTSDDQASEHLNLQTKKDKKKEG